MTDTKKRFSILLVDDEVDLIEAIKDTIDGYFEKVHIAYNVQSALEVLAKNSIDIVLCDLKMPNEDGLLLRNIMIQSYPGVHFALLTGYSDDPRIAAAQTTAAFPVLEKPSRPDVLISRLLNMMTSKSASDLSESNYLATLSPKEKDRYLELSEKDKKNELIAFSEKARSTNRNQASNKKPKVS